MSRMFSIPPTAPDHGVCPGLGGVFLGEAGDGQDREAGKQRDVLDALLAIEARVSVGLWAGGGMWPRLLAPPLLASS